MVGADESTTTNPCLTDTLGKWLQGDLSDQRLAVHPLWQGSLVTVRIDIRVDVSTGIALDPPLSMAAWVHLPDPARSPYRPSIFFAFPGGTYTRAYYDMQIPGRAGYSFAEHLAAAGHIVVSCDHIGLGDSTPYEPFESLTKEVVLAGMSGLVDGVISRLTTGTLTDEIGPIDNPFIVGAGHSMGGYLLTMQQGRTSTFDALAVLGYSPLRRWDHQAISRHRELMDRMGDATRPRPHLDRAFLYGEGVPDDVIAFDFDLAVRLYSWALRKEANETIVDPEARSAAAKVTVPIFVGLGAHDMSPNPHAEAGAYVNSSDVTILIVPGAAHCFNLAEKRQLFFERLASWGHAMVTAYGGQP